MLGIVEAVPAAARGGLVNGCAPQALRLYVSFIAPSLSGHLFLSKPEKMSMLRRTARESTSALVRRQLAPTLGSKVFCSKADVDVLFFAMYTAIYLADRVLSKLVHGMVDHDIHPRD